jgi:hypothetical protein
VLDFCHAVHHVSLALAGLNLTPDERQRWHRTLRKQLRAGQAYQVTASLSLLAEEKSGTEAAWTAIRFLGNRSPVEGNKRTARDRITKGEGWASS